MHSDTHTHRCKRASVFGLGLIKIYGKKEVHEKKCLGFAFFITGADAISLGLLVLFTRLHTVAVNRVLAKLPRDSRVC